jgi:hypothetical protein
MNKIYYTLLPFLFLQRSSDNIDFLNWIHNFLFFSSSFFFENYGKSQNNTKAKTMKIIMISFFPFLNFLSFILFSLHSSFSLNVCKMKQRLWKSM